MSPPKKIELILAIIGQDYGIEPDALRLPTENYHANEARFIAMLLVRRHVQHTHAWIADYFKYQNARNKITETERRTRSEPKLLIRITNIEKTFFTKINRYR